jgi:cyanophycin synthetase
VPRAGELSQDPAEPPRAFEHSRRLTGANRWYGRPAVELEPLGPALEDGRAQGRWLGFVHAMAFALGWPDPEPRVHEHAGGLILAFVAPEDQLFTATEINEWAWERAAPWHHAQAGLVPLQPASDDAAPHFKARAAAERSRPLARLREAAAEHDLPLLADDDSITLGEGAGSVTYPRAALPLPMDVPWPRLQAVPKLLVTGSNGKTTTTRLLAAMAEAAGFVHGLCGTEGVVVGGETVAPGDWAGPAGARAVLRHPRVTAAVLETARGGILRRGLAMARADVAVLTNISADHIGEYGVQGVEDIAEVKLALAHAVAGHGALVMNGSDEVLLRTAMQLQHAMAARWALFARSHDASLLATLRQHGVRLGRLVVWHEGHEHDLGAIASMPLTLGGAAGYQIENAAAAALAAVLAGWPIDAVRDTLARFGSRPADNPGRLEHWPWRGATVLLDYAHNPDGLTQLLDVAQALKPKRLGLLLGQAGNRDDLAITDLARVAAAARPALVLIKELPAMLRGRPLGEVPAVLERGLLAGGLRPDALRHEPDEAAAAQALLAWAAPGDVIVLPVHTAAVREQVVAQLSGPGG